ncbi:MAG: cytochrome c [Terracidiphilus sp.]|nr:cytochrome c [Terracidiphilus sp.]
MLKPFSLLSVVALLAVAPIALQAPAAQEPAKAPAKGSAQLLEKAKTLYKMDCALCHNANGDGKTDIAKDMSLNLDDWTDPKTLANRPDEALFDVIRHGKGKMPAEDANRAKDDEVKALIQYIRSMASATPAAPAASPAAPTGVTATPGSGR